MTERIIELAPHERGVLRPFYGDYPGCEGIVDAILEGTMGRAYADDRQKPRVGLLSLDFQCIGGDAATPAAEALVRSLPRPCTILVPDAAWVTHVRAAFGDIGTRERVEFRAGPFDRARLEAAVASLPDGYAIKRVTADDVAEFGNIDDSLVYNFGSTAAFLERGIGWAIVHEGRIVSGCSSFCISSKKLEFEIQTIEPYQRRGLAYIAASRMILRCLDAGLVPCWDAHNPPSAALAAKLGFIDPRPYTAYEVR